VYQILIYSPYNIIIVSIYGIDYVNH